MSEQTDKYIAKNQKCLSAAVKKLVFFGPQLVFFGPPDTVPQIFLFKPLSFSNFLNA